MLIFTADGWKSFSSIPAAPIPVEPARLTRNWINARNESLAELRALVARAKVRFASDPRYPGCAEFVVPPDVEMPDWCKIS